MKALVVERKPARFASARVAGFVAPGAGAKWGPLDLEDIDEPGLPGADWVRVVRALAGICGSDLATVDGVASRYFEPIVSFPFVPGHEVVGTAADGSRVVLEPVLGCVSRGIEPLCQACAAGHLGNCERLAFGRIEAGLQTGFCCDTGGGWGSALVAHPSQLHPVAEDLSDEAAVMVEPTACAVHGALRTPIAHGDAVVVIGAGTLGLLTVAALREFTGAGDIVVGARYPHQQRLAKELGATAVAEPSEIPRLVRRMTHSMAYGEQLTGGAATVIDCVGDSTSISQALQLVRPRGAVVMLGMPATVKVELTSLWHRETQLVGAYAYGTEEFTDGRPNGRHVRTFDLAFQLVRSAQLERLVSAVYPLRDYHEALSHAANAGRRGAVKIAFDLRDERKG